MLQGWVVIVVALGYIGLLFVIASYGDHARAPCHRRADDDLSALARDLLHVVDVLRLGRPRLAHRLRLPRDLCRPDPDGRARLAADPARRAAREDAEHHLDRGLHRGALRQASGGRRDRRADRDHRQHSLHRAAAQSSVGVARHDPDASRHHDRHGAAGARRYRAVRCARDGGVRGAVRHAPHRCDRASGRADPRDRDGIADQACGVRHRRRVRHVLPVRRTGGAVHQGDGDAAHRGGAHARAGVEHADHHDAALDRGDRAAAAPVPRDGGGESQRLRDPPRRLAVSALSRADQPVRHPDRDRRPDDVPARRRQRHVRAGAAAVGGLRDARARRLRRRTVGRDRNGDRRDGRARHHGVERHRGAVRAEAARGAAVEPRRCRHDPAHGAAVFDLPDPVSRLSLLSLCR